MSNDVTLPPLFIMGCPRSGTTLVASLLSGSPWGSPFETHFIPKYYDRLEKFGSLKEKVHCQRLVRSILSERPVRQWKLDFDVEGFCRGLSSHDYSYIVNQLCVQRRYMKGFRSWADKTPHYILHLQTIHSLFPNSKIVYVVRDGRDVALSLQKMSWGPSNIYGCATYWTRCNRWQPIFEVLEKKSQLFTLRYEDLLADPELVMKRFGDFLEVPFDQDNLDRVMHRIRRSNSYKWRHEMDSDDVRTFEQVCAGTLRRLGYETTYEESPVRGIRRWALRLPNTIKHITHLIRTNIVDGVRIYAFGKEPFRD